jgi:hypothetical protein
MSSGGPVDGRQAARIIGLHLVPGFMSHLIASATITIPGMILGETALSFLGLGLRPPITSWGILLTEARSVSVIAFYPWLLFPIIPVILVILAFNFLGDGCATRPIPTNEVDGTDMQDSATRGVAAAPMMEPRGLPHDAATRRCPHPDVQPRHVRPRPFCGAAGRSRMRWSRIIAASIS